MKIVLKQEIHLSSDDIKQLGEIANLAIMPHLDSLRELDSDEEVKIFNTMTHGESVITDKKRDKMVALFKKAIHLIEEKRVAIEHEVEAYPEIASGIVTRPQDFGNIMLENYSIQIKLLNEAVKILIVENLDGFDE